MQLIYPLIIGAVYSVSFFGNSIIENDVSGHSTRETTIKIKLLTKQEYSVILSAEDESGFIEIGIHHGRPYVKYKIADSSIQKLSSTVRVDDLNTHTIRVSRVENDFRFIVDGEIALESKLMANSYDLKFDTIKIGQKWSNNKNKLIGFRGCLYQVKFNAIDLLISTSSQRIEHIERDECSRELRSIRGDAISLYGADAFASFVVSTKDIIINFEFRSNQPAAQLLLLPLILNGYLSLELVNYQLVFSLVKHDARVWSKKLTCDKDTANEWNTVNLVLKSGRNPELQCNHMMIYIDTHNKHALDLSGLANFGNYIQVRKSENRLNMGICLKAIIINDVAKKVGDIVLSSKLQLACPPAVDMFGSNRLTHSDSPDYTLIRQPVQMQVDEGERDSFKDLIQTVYQGRVIHFVITEHPMHGSLIDSSNSVIDGFSSANIQVIYYANDGSEHVRDRFSFKDKENTIEYLINVTINLINDPPVFASTDISFKPIIGFSNLLTTEYISLTDDDTDSSNVKIHVLGRYQPPNSAEHTYFFNKNNPEREIIRFMLSELENNEIYIYQSKDPLKYRLIFKAVDGSNTSNMRILYTQPSVLNLIEINNNVVRVRQGSQMVLSNDHLEYTSNALTDAGINITYEVVEIPEMGDLRHFHNNEWSLAEKFTQDDVNHGLVRYLQDNSKKNKKQDSILLEATVPGSDYSKEVVLNFEIIKIIFELSTEKITVQDSYEEKHPLNITITTSVLESNFANDKNIQFSFPAVLQFSELYYGNEVLVNTEKWFNLADLQKLNLYLKLRQKIRFQTTEQLWIKMRLSDGDETQLALLIKYNPDPETIFLTNEGLEAYEGGKTLIKRENLFAANFRDDRLEIELTKEPQFGTLRLINFNNKPEVNITRIKVDDIEQQRLFYDHDDSESEEDEFSFILRNIDFTGKSRSSALSEEYTFKIIILLKNDHAPERQNDRVLTVVTNGMKIITEDDLWFHDEDIDLNDKDIVISRRTVNGGDIINATTSKDIFQFKQEDILNKQVAFSHRGLSYNEFVFWAKDDSHSSASLMRVQAGPPLITIDISPTFSIQKDSTTSIKEQNMTLSTNMNIALSEINWFLVDEPHQGEFQIDGTRVRQWKHGDVLAGRLTYTHTSKKSIYSDQFTLKAYHARLESSGRKVAVNYFMEHYQLPLKLIKHEQLGAHEKTSVTITKKDLLVTHESATPSMIQFMITKQPAYGAISNLNGDPVKNFTQLDIIHQNIMYTNDQAALVDAFELNVTNYFTYIDKIKMAIEIMPKIIPLRPMDASVDEGESVALASAFKILGNVGEDFTIRVIEKCTHGTLRKLGTKKDVKKFSYAERNSVLYIHDGSENYQDHCTVQALPVADDNFHERSENVTLTFLIDPVNDQRPEMVNNIVLVVWQNSVTEITPTDLKYIDNDTPPEELVYELSATTGGHLALRNNPEKKIQKFTQQDINTSKLVFVSNLAHEGPSRGGFNFQVSDSSFSVPLKRFVIEMRRLSLNLQLNTKFTCHPGEMILISKNDFWAITNDPETNRTIYFSVERRSQNGEIVDKNKTPISHFSQWDILNGNVWYMPDNEIPDWTTTDYFLFSVNSVPANPLNSKSFYIQITYERETGVSLARLNPLHIKEGKSIVITSKYVDASNFYKKIMPGLAHSDFELFFSLSRPPAHGELMMSGRPMKKGYDFAQEDLNKGRIKYVHDHSDSVYDHIEIKTGLMDLRRENAPNLIDTKFNITVEIEGENDNIPKLENAKKLFNFIKGVPNSFKLNLTDADNDDVIIRIVSASSLGIFVRGRNSTTEIEQFTNKESNIYFLPKQDADVDQPDGVTISFSDNLHPTQYRPLRTILRKLTLKITSSVITLVQGSYIKPLTTEFINITTNGYLEDVWCLVSRSLEYGNLMKDSAPATNITAMNIVHSEVVIIIEEKSMTEDSFTVSCSNNHIAAVEQLKLRVISGVHLRLPFLVLNPSAPTKFGASAIDFSALAQYVPLDFISSPNHRVRFIKMTHFRTRRSDLLEGNPLVTEVESRNITAPNNRQLIEWNGFKFEEIDKFTSDDLENIFIELIGKENQTEIKIDVSGVGIPTVPFIFSAMRGESNNQTTLPFFGLSESQILGEQNDTNGESPSINNSTSKINHLEDARTSNGKDSKREPSGESTTRKVPRNEAIGETLTIERLLYIIPIALIIVLLVVFIVVIIFTRKSRQKQKSLGYTVGNLQAGIIKTEEGAKSTTYIIPAACDSTVKVTVQQSRYEQLLPTTTVKPIGPEESVYGGSSDDGGHTAYAGSNYFGVMSMSQPYPESRMEEEFEDDSIDSYQADAIHHEANTIHRQKQFWV